MEVRSDRSHAGSRRWRPRVLGQERPVAGDRVLRLPARCASRADRRGGAGAESHRRARWPAAHGDGRRRWIPLWRCLDRGGRPPGRGHGCLSGRGRPSARRGRRHSRRAERIRLGGVPVGASGDGSRNGVRRSHRCLARGLYRTVCRGVPRARGEVGSRAGGRQRHLLRRAASHEPRDPPDQSGWRPCGNSGSHRQASAGQIRGRGGGLLTTHERSGHRGTGLP